MDYIERSWGPALEELDRLKSTALNDRVLFSNYLISCNIRSLKAHFPDISSSPHIKNANLICLQETWLTDDIDYENELEIEGFTAHFCSVGKKKGVVTYCKQNYEKIKEIKTENYQMLSVELSDLNIINIYKSSTVVSTTTFINDVRSLFNEEKETLIVGDFNICYEKERKHLIITQLMSMGFDQKVKSPTHVQGRCIDHVYHYSPTSDDNISQVRILQFGQFFTDHDMLLVDLPSR